MSKRIEPVKMAPVLDGKTRAAGTPTDAGVEGGRHMVSHVALTGQLGRWLAAMAMVALAVMVLALAISHGDGNRALAIGDGDFTATLFIAVEGLEPFECTISGSLEGGSERVPDTEAYNVTDKLVDATGLCLLDPSTDEDDLTQIIQGTVLGVVSEIESNGNDVVDGLAEGRFEIRIEADTTSLGVIRTIEDEPIVITCPEIDLGDGRSDERISYRCDLVLDAEHPPVTLYGEGPMATIEAMAVDFTGVPAYGGGGGRDSGLGTWVIVVIAVAVLAGLAVVVAFGYQAMNRGEKAE